MTKIDEHLVDKRIVERNIKKGLLTRKEYEGYLTKLEDSESKAELVSFADEEE